MCILKCKSYQSFRSIAGFFASCFGGIANICAMLAGQTYVKVLTCPAFAESITKGDLRWEKAVGDAVSKDEVICEVETVAKAKIGNSGDGATEELLVEDGKTKTSVSVPSPCAGVIEELLVEDGSTVNPGMKLVKIKVGATAIAPKCTCAPKGAEGGPSAPPLPPDKPPVVEQPAGRRFKPPTRKIFWHF